MGVAAALLLASTSALAEDSRESPRLTGKYRCEPEPRECLLGKTFTVAQSGNRLETKNEKGERSYAHVISDRSLTMGSPWNMLGVIYGTSIQWSNGTKWAKAD
jgi:hypothetical protein